MKYSAIIFDWDGTIGMTLHLWLEGYRISLKNQGYDISDEVIAKDFFYEHDKGQLKYPTVDFTKLVDEARAYVLSHIPSLALYPNARETLETLERHGVTLALVSSSARRLLEAGLHQHALLPFFKSIIAGDDITRHKPHPEAFLRTLDTLHVRAEDTLIIGDSHTDMWAGEAAQVARCLFTPPENGIFYDNAVLAASNPDYQIDSLDKLRHVLGVPQG
jgi:HAD superfamily hydrolase (TIGR01509 family)